MKTIRLTAGQALVRFLINQFVRLDDGGELLFFAGVWAIFGHGNVAGIGEALFQVRDQLPTYRGHNEQGMAHAAIAFAKARRRPGSCGNQIPIVPLRASEWVFRPGRMVSAALRCFPVSRGALRDLHGGEA